LIRASVIELRERFSRGVCIGCGKQTYTAKDYEDPRGPLGLMVYAPLIASEYGMSGPDVAACWGCTENDEHLYRIALQRAKGFWTYSQSEQSRICMQNAWAHKDDAA